MQALDPWWNHYVSPPIPFVAQGRTRAGLDCWGLFCLVYKEVFGIDLPAFAGGEYVDPHERSTVNALLRGNVDALWRKVDQPREGDGAMFQFVGDFAHVGLWLPGNLILHSLDGAETCIEPVRRLSMLGYKIAGYYRHNARPA